MHDFTELRRQALVKALRGHMSGEVRFDETSRRLYSTDASIYQVTPLGAALPKTADDLVACVQIAADMRVPIVPRGGGTSLSGQSLALQYSSPSGTGTPPQHVSPEQQAAPPAQLSPSPAQPPSSGH